MSDVPARRQTAFLRLAATLAGLLALGACENRTAVDPGNVLYASLARPGTQLDNQAAAAVINGYRRSLGLGAVTIDAGLSRFAEAQLDKVAGSSSLTIPGGLALQHRLASAGIRARIASENVSAGYYSMSDAFSGWRGSPPNDATLRLAGATRMGLAARAVPGSKYGVYWVLVMAGDPA